MTTLAVQTGEFARDLYDLLRQLDRPPGTDAAEALKARIERVRTRCRQLVESEAAREEAAQGLVRAVKAFLAPLDELWSRLADGLSIAGAVASFRAAAAPLYEALVARLKALRVEAPSLRPQNLTRSAYHVANGLFAAACIELLPTWNWVIAVAATFFAFAWTMELGRRVVPGWNRFAMWLFRSVAHPHEEHRINSATWYSTALFSLALLSGPVPSLLGVLSLGLGDPAAAFVGRRWGRRRVWAGQSVEGAVAFAVVASGVCFGALALFHPALGVGLRVALAAAAGVVGAVVELVSGRVDDNLSIPLAVAAAATWILWLAGN